MNAPESICEHKFDFLLHTTKRSFFHPIENWGKEASGVSHKHSTRMSALEKEKGLTKSRDGQRMFEANTCLHLTNFSS